jgi:hypothetical protein
MLSVYSIDGTDCISQGMILSNTSRWISWSFNLKLFSCSMMLVISVCSSNHSMLSVCNIDGTDCISQGMIAQACIDSVSQLDITHLDRSSRLGIAHLDSILHISIAHLDSILRISIEHLDISTWYCASARATAFPHLCRPLSQRLLHCPMLTRCVPVHAAGQYSATVSTGKLSK